MWFSFVKLGGFMVRQNQLERFGSLVVRGNGTVGNGMDGSMEFAWRVVVNPGGFRLWWRRCWFKSSMMVPWVLVTDRFRGLRRRKVGPVSTLGCRASPDFVGEWQ